MNNGKTLNINDSFQSMAYSGCPYSNSLNNGKGSPLIHWKWVTNLFCPHYVTTEYGVTIEDAVEDNQLTQTIIIG